MAISVARKDPSLRDCAADEGWTDNKHFAHRFAGQRCPGKIIGASKVARDITERKLAEVERERLMQQEQAARRIAEEASRLKDDFSQPSLMELRIPLIR